MVELSEIVNNEELDEQQQLSSEQSLQSQYSQLEAVIGSMTEGIVMVETTGTIKIANNAAKAMLGLPRTAELATVKTTLADLGLAKLFEADQVEANKQPGQFITKSSQAKTLQIKWTPVIDRTESFIGNIITLQDTTAQIELERIKNDFVSSISHELRTPLTTIQNSISNILAGVTGSVPKKTRNYLKTMYASGNRLSQIINNLLDMAKLESGNMPVNRSTTDLAKIAGKAVDAFADLARQKNIELNCRIEDHIPPVYVDSQRIYQVLTNLIANAVRYTSPAGKVTVRLYNDADSVVTIVEDTGIGIPPDSHKIIFNKFYQISRNVGPGYNGNGLGLALSEKLVRMHGGKIWLQSRQGHGSTFFFSLPKTQPQIILRKHLKLLTDRVDRNRGQFAMLIVRFELTTGDEKEIHCADTAVTQILNNSELLTRSDDLVIRTGDLEVFFVLAKTNSDYLQEVVKKIRDRIKNAVQDSGCPDTQIAAMIGIGLYPDDCNDIEKLEKITRQNAKRFL